MTALLMGLAVPAAWSQEPAPSASPASHAEVRKLIEATGGASGGEQILSALFGSMKKSRPEVPDAVWDDLKAEMRIDDMIELVIPIYQKYLDADDIRALMTFFESPVGRKMARLQPQIMIDSIAVGQRWGEECARRVLQRLNEKGYPGKTSADVSQPSRTLEHA